MRAGRGRAALDRRTGRGRLTRGFAAALVAGATAVVVGPGGPAGAAEVTTTFEYTGDAQSWTVPEGVCRITVDAYGAQGGGSTTEVEGQILLEGLDGHDGPALGGRATATVLVVPGEVLRVYVGGAGDDGSVNVDVDAQTGTAIAETFAGQGGFNGGGDGGGASAAATDEDQEGSIAAAAGAAAGGGGGASDVRRGGDGLAHRVVVAGGGGGAAAFTVDALIDADPIEDGVQDQSELVVFEPGGGGHGGGSEGAAGTDGESAPGTGGGGGTATAGGAGGAGFVPGDGAVGQGGFGEAESDSLSSSELLLVGLSVTAGGGGGGGWFGGGGGGVSPRDGGFFTGGAGGGGGGSGYAPGGALETGVREGDGLVLISYDPADQADCLTPVIAPRFTG